jgi:hypothetical protein
MRMDSKDVLYLMMLEEDRAEEQVSSRKFRYEFNGSI